MREALQPVLIVLLFILLPFIPIWFLYRFLKKRTTKWIRFAVPAAAYVSLLLLVCLAFFASIAFRGCGPSERTQPHSTDGGPRAPIKALLELDQILAALPIGNIAYNRPTKMNLEETVNIRLVLSPSMSVQDLQSLLQSHLKSHETIAGHQVKIASQMKAHLTGSNFSINQVTDEIQPVSLSIPTTWQWQVTPKKEGTHLLQLTLSVIIFLSDERLPPRAIKTFEDTIEVEVSIVTKIAEFVKGNWPWLCTVLLIPLVRRLWKKRKLLQSDKKRNSPTS